MAAERHSDEMAESDGVLGHESSSSSEWELNLGPMDSGSDSESSAWELNLGPMDGNSSSDDEDDAVAKYSAKFKELAETKRAAVAKRRTDRKFKKYSNGNRERRSVEAKGVCFQRRLKEQTADIEAGQAVVATFETIKACTKKKCEGMVLKSWMDYFIQTLLLHRHILYTHLKSRSTLLASRLLETHSVKTAVGSEQLL